MVFNNILGYIKKFSIFIDILLIPIMLNVGLIPQMILYTIAVLIHVIDLDIYHPRCWYTAIFYSYSIGYPLLYVLGLLDSNYGCSSMLIPIQFIGLVAFWIGTLTPKTSFQIGARFRLLNDDRMPVNILQLILIVGDLCILFTIGLLLSGGYTNKASLYASGNIILIFFMSYVYLHVIITFFYWIYNDRFNKVVFISVLLPCLQGLVSGERDVVFHVLIMSCLLLYSKGYLKRRFFIIAMPVLLIMIPLSASLKYIFLTGIGPSVNFVNDISALIHDFFYSEFIAASRNVQMVLRSTIPENYSLFSLPLSVLTRFLDISYVAPLNYFNEVNYHGSMVGHGFTIIGEGLYYANTIGVIALMLLTGWISKKLYEKSFHSAYEKTLYLYTAPLFMYACRGELSSVIVPLIKYGIVSFLVLELLCEFLSRKRVSE